MAFFFHQGKCVRFTELHESVGVVWSDIQQFACLMCELFLGARLLPAGPGTSLHQRYNTIGRLWTNDKQALPRLYFYIGMTTFCS